MDPYYVMGHPQKCQPLGLHFLGQQSHVEAMYMPSRIRPPMYHQSQDPQEDIPKGVLVCVEGVADGWDQFYPLPYIGASHDPHPGTLKYQNSQHVSPR